MLWQVGKSSLHILGGIHLLPEAPVFTAAEAEVMARVELFAFESDFALGLDPISGCYRGTRRMSDDIPEPLLLDATRLWSELQPDQSDMLIMRPWWAALQIMKRLLRREGLNPSYGIDRVTMDIAKRSRRDLVFLVPVRAGIEPFACAPAHEQLECLARAVYSFDEGIADVLSMVQAWRSRDPAALIPMREKFLRQMPRTYSALLGGRNRKWMPKLVGISKGRKPALAIVGVMHMLGADGLVELLREARLECTQVA